MPSGPDQKSIPTAQRPDAGILATLTEDDIPTLEHLTKLHAAITDDGSLKIFLGQTNKRKENETSFINTFFEEGLIIFEKTSYGACCVIKAPIETILAKKKHEPKLVEKDAFLDFLEDLDLIIASAENKLIPLLKKTIGKEKLEFTQDIIQLKKLLPEIIVRARDIANKKSLFDQARGTTLESLLKPSASAADSKSTVVTDKEASWPVIWLALDIDGLLVNNKKQKSGHVEWNSTLRKWKNFLRERINEARTHKVKLKIAVVSARELDTVADMVAEGLQEFLFCETKGKVKIQVFDGKKFALGVRNEQILTTLPSDLQFGHKQKLAEGNLVPFFLTEGTFKSPCLQKLQEWDRCPAANVILWDDMIYYRREAESKGFGTIAAGEHADDPKLVCDDNPEFALEYARGILLAKIKSVGQQHQISAGVVAITSGLVNTLAARTAIAVPTIAVAQGDGASKPPVPVAN